METLAINLLELGKGFILWLSRTLHRDWKADRIDRTIARWDARRLRRQKRRLERIRESVKAMPFEAVRSAQMAQYDALTKVQQQIGHALVRQSGVAYDVGAEPKSDRD